MRQILKGILVLFALCQSAFITCVAGSDHLSQLKSKYPYGLLSDDAGILNEGDLALNACHVKPRPFIAGALNPYQYWLCFENKAVLPICEDQEFSNEDGHVGRVVVQASDHEFAYEFIESRPWPIRSCRNFVKSLKKLMSGTTHSCVSVAHIGKEKKNEHGRLERIGILHRFKTRKGCEGEECVLTEKTKRETCPDL